MADTLHGFPFWEFQFDQDGAPVDKTAAGALPADVKSQGVTDLFVFSHGWNNDHKVARILYDSFFEQLAALWQDSSVTKKNPAARIGLAGVHWPSILWPDDTPDAGAQPELPAPSTGGTVALNNPATTAQKKTATADDIQSELKLAYKDPKQQELIDDLTALLREEPEDDAAISLFRSKLAELLATEQPDAIDKQSPEDAEAGVVSFNDKKWRKLLTEVGRSAERRGSATKGGAVGLGDEFKKMWNGAKDVFRIGTYWQMKKRAGVVGREGLGRLVTRLAQENPGIRVHLIGHSFGARLVSFSLSGLPDAMTGATSPVKSLFLLQGAFSHYAFADELPHDATRGGALKGMAVRVDGPLLTTHSLRDYAVGASYPAASMTNNEDAAAFDSPSKRWGAMGHDGAQAVSAASDLLSLPGAKYPLAKGQWLNLDGNSVIIHGKLPSGAHSDIVHPHTAWAALAAAGLV